MKSFYFALCIAVSLHYNKAFGSEGGMPQLNTEFWISQIFWLVFIFSSLYLIIWKIFLPRVTYSIENRKSKVMNDLHEAQKLKESAEKKLSEYNKIIEDSKNEAKKIIEESNKVLNLDIEKKKHKFNNEIEKEIIAVEKEIKALQKSSISSINKIATEISEEVIKQIIDSEVNKSNVAAIVEDVTKKEMEKHT
tara:strand:+ start:74 stop:652 length:579 start_codon:yes stop_codon:yes gene_type:complete